MSGDVDVGKNEEVLDPRIKDELEALNSAAESINKLENEVQRARLNFRLQKAECAEHLNLLVKKIGKKFIIKSRPYYEMLKHLQKLQLETQRVTAKYQKANSIYKAAQETVTLAEEQLVGDDGGKLAFDAAWQEMLNHANRRFMEAESEKRICEVEHQKCSKEFESLQQKVALLHKDLNRAISKSKPFYDAKKKFENKLQAERQNAEDLQLALMCSKQKYKMALTGLERISEEIHMQRKVNLSERTPGVGAESDTCSDLSDMQSINFGDFLSETSSQVSKDDLADFDSDLGFDDEWSGVSLNASSSSGNKITINTSNTVDGFFNKISNKFNRSNSLGYINASEDTKFSLPSQISKDDSFQDLQMDDQMNNSGLKFSRDNTLEGAEHQEEMKDKFKENVSNLETAPPPSLSSSSYYPSNKRFTSAAYFTMSTPIDKSKHLCDGSSGWSTPSRDNKPPLPRATPMKMPQPFHKQHQPQGVLQNIDTEPLQQLPIQQIYQHHHQAQQQPLQHQHQNLQRTADQQLPCQHTSANQPPVTEHTFQMASLDKVNHFNVVQPYDPLTEHNDQSNRGIPFPTPQSQHYNPSKKLDALPHTQLLNNLFSYKQKLTSIDKQMDRCYLTDVNSIDSHQVIKSTSDGDHQKRDETLKGKKGPLNEEIFV